MTGFLIAAGLIYVILTLAATWLVQTHPRKPVVDPPDWGRIKDTWVMAADGGRLELWDITPDSPCGGTVVFVHGWGRNRDRMVILEASYADTRKALLSLYHWVHPAFGLLFGRAILFWMDRFYPGALDRFSPVRLAGSIAVPVLLVHGEADRRFPVAFARDLHRHFSPGQADLYVAPGAGHSDSSITPGYAEAIRRFLDRHEPDGGASP